MSSASAEDIFCMKRGVGNAKCEVVVSPSAMIKRRVAAANALRTLADIPHPLGPSTRTAQKYGKGEYSQTTCHPDQASARGGIYAPI